MKGSKFYKLVFGILLFVFITSFNSDNSKYPPRSAFPHPEGINNLLFYIQRAKDINTIIYELNIDESGNLVEDNPIKPYWIRYAEDKQVMPLTMIQQKFAYGLKMKTIDEKNKIYQFCFVSYHKKYFYLRQNKKDKKFHVYGKINNKLAELDNIFINIQGGSFWFPKIEYVAINAKDIKSKEKIVEKVIP